MTASVPAWASDFASKGHSGRHNDLNGGTYGDVGGHWLKFMLRAEKESKDYFQNDDMAKAGWNNMVKKNLDKIATK
jgi:hypothetical protein